MRTLAATRTQQLFWHLLSSQSLSVAWRNDNSSGSRTRFLLFQCDLSPTWGYIRQRCSLCRCRLLCESIPKLHVAALQPPWPREQFGILRKLFETLLGRAGASPPLVVRMEILCVRTYVRPYCMVLYTANASPYLFQRHALKIITNTRMQFMASVSLCSSWRPCL